MTGVASTTVITTAILALAGISDPLAASLVGKTVAEAGEWLEVIYLLKTSTEMVTAGMVKKYGLEGQSVEQFTAGEVLACLKFIKKLASTGGPCIVPIYFEAPA